MRSNHECNLKEWGLQVMVILANISSSKLAFYLTTTGLLLLYLWSWIKKIAFANSSPLLVMVLESLVIFVATFLWGSFGIICAARKEFPQVIMIRGKIAVFFGIWITICFWSIGLYAIVHTIFIILNLY